MDTIKLICISWIQMISDKAPCFWDFVCDQELWQPLRVVLCKIAKVSQITDKARQEESTALQIVDPVLIFREKQVCPWIENDFIPEPSDPVENHQIHQIQQDSEDDLILLIIVLLSTFSLVVFAGLIILYKKRCGGNVNKEQSPTQVKILNQSSESLNDEENENLERMMNAVKDNEHLRADNEEKSRTIEGLNSTCGELERRTIQLQGELAEAVSKVKKLEMRIREDRSKSASSLPKENSSVQTDFSTVDDLKEEILRLELVIQQKDKELSDNEQNIESLQSHLEKIDSQNNQTLEKDIDEAIEINDLHERLALSCQVNHNLMAHLRKLEAFMEDLLQHKNLDSSSLSETSTRLTNCLDETKKLSSALSDHLSICENSKLFDSSDISLKRSYSQSGRPSFQEDHSRLNKTSNSHYTHQDTLKSPSACKKCSQSPSKDESAEKVQLQKVVSDLSNKCSNQENELDELREALNNARTENVALTEQKRELTTFINILEKELKIKTTELSLQSTESSGSLAEISGENSKLRKSIELLETKSSESDSVIKKLNKELEDTKMRLQSLDNKCSNYELELASSSKNLKDYNEKYGSVVNEKDQLLNKVQELVSKRNELLESIQSEKAKIQRFEKENGELKGELREKSESLASLQSQYTELQNSSSELLREKESKLLSSSSTCNELQAQLKSYESVVEEKNELFEKIRKLGETKNELLQSIQLEKNKTQEFEKENRELKRKLHESSQSLASLQSQFSELEKTSSESQESLEREKNKLLQQIQKFDSTKRHLCEEIESENNRALRLDSQIWDLKTELQEKSQSLESLQSQYAKLEKTSTELLREKDSKLLTSSSTCDDLKKQLKKYQESYESLKQTSEVKTSFIKDLKSEMFTNCNSLVDKQKEVDDMRRQLCSSKELCTQLKLKTKEERSKFRFSDHMHSDIEAEIKTLKSSPKRASNNLEKSASSPAKTSHDNTSDRESLSEEILHLSRSGSVSPMSFEGLFQSFKSQKNSTSAKEMLGIESDPNHESSAPEQGQDVARLSKRQESGSRGNVPESAAQTLAGSLTTLQDRVPYGSGDASLHAMGSLPHYELLKKEVSESLVGIKSVLIRARDGLQRTSKFTSPGKNLECAIFMAIKDTSGDIEVCLEAARKLVDKFWIAPCPSVEELNNLIQLSQEQHEQIRRMTEAKVKQEQYWDDALDRLKQAEIKKNKLEKKISKRQSHPSSRSEVVGARQEPNSHA